MSRLLVVGLECVSWARWLLSSRSLGPAQAPLRKSSPQALAGLRPRMSPLESPFSVALAVAAMPHASKPAESPGLRALDSAPPGLLPSWSPTPLALLREGVFPRFQG